MISAQDKPTSLNDARDAIDANMGTPIGKAYDEQFGAQCIHKHLGKQSKRSSGNRTSFRMLFTLDKDGSVREKLLAPETKPGVGARASLLTEKFATVPTRGP